MAKMTAGAGSGVGRMQKAENAKKDTKTANTLKGVPPHIQHPTKHPDGHDSGHKHIKRMMFKHPNSEAME